MPTFAVLTSTGQTIRVHSPSAAEATRHVDVLSVLGVAILGVQVTGSATQATRIKE